MVFNNTFSRLLIIFISIISILFLSLNVFNLGTITPSIYDKSNKITDPLSSNQYLPLNLSWWNVSPLSLAEPRNLTITLQLGDNFSDSEIYLEYIQLKGSEVQVVTITPIFSSSNQTIHTFEINNIENGIHYYAWVLLKTDKNDLYKSEILEFSSILLEIRDIHIEEIFTSGDILELNLTLNNYLFNNEIRNLRVKISSEILQDTFDESFIIYQNTSNIIVILEIIDVEDGIYDLNINVLIEKTNWLSLGQWKLILKLIFQ